MTTKYQPYSKYKPSGVEWLGDVTEGWNAVHMKYLASCCISNVDKLVKTDEETDSKE